MSPVLKNVDQSYCGFITVLQPFCIQVVPGVPPGVVVIFQFMAETCYTDGAEPTLGKCGAVGRSPEERHLACFAWNTEDLFMCVLPLSPFFLWHIIGVWRRKGKRLDPMLPLLVLSTFVLALIYSMVYNIEVTCSYPIW